jgi:hypothetical protein
MRLTAVAILLAACTPVAEFAPRTAFGEPQTVTLDGRDLTIRTASNDPVLRSALVSGTQDMTAAMGVPGMPRTGAHDFVDSFRVGGATGRNDALAVVAAFCAGQPVGLPLTLADTVVRIDAATGEYVVPIRCGG